MCRLFGLTAGAARVRATFWLLDAPDSVEVQGYRNVDGSGIGFFDSAGAPVLDKQPEPASADEDFIHQSKVGRVDGLCRARALGDRRRPDCAEHAPVRYARPHHGAQRRVR